VSQPFDATLKEIVRRHLADYVAEFRLAGMTAVLDVDMSTVSAATDVVLADANPPRRELATLDFQSGHDEFLDDRILMYQGVLRNRYHVPVHSVVLLLRPDAYRPSMTGGVRYDSGRGRGKMDFRYELVRLWQIPAEQLLATGIGTAALAVLGRLPERRDTEVGLEAVFREFDRRLRAEVEPAEAKDLRASVRVLMGLRITKAAALALVERVTTMEESTVYQVILEKGEARGEARGLAVGARRTLLATAKARLGRPTKKTVAALEAIADVDRLIRMGGALGKAKSWHELLAVE
jgi:hypothetical protein